MNEEVDGTSGVSRRDVLRRSAIVGGALVWTTPVVQSIASPAFASGSPGGDEECASTYQFKIEAGTGQFSTGQTPNCVPDGYDPNGTNFVGSDGTIPNGHGKISVSIDNSGDGGGTATITLPTSCKLLSGGAKAGSGKGGTLECVASTVTGIANVYTVTLPTRDISFVAGVFCC